MRRDNQNRYIYIAPDGSNHSNRRESWKYDAETFGSVQTHTEAGEVENIITAEQRKPADLEPATEVSQKRKPAALEPGMRIPQWALT